MPVYQNKENQTWYVKCYYKDWQGVNRPLVLCQDFGLHKCKKFN